MGSSKTLGELAELVDGHVIGNAQTVVDDVTHDSRQAGPGTLFVAIVGESHDGHDFIDQARASGAAAICVERDVSTDIDHLVVGDTRTALGQLAAEVHAHPSRAMDVLGVTGTNGKTTVTHYIESLLGGLGFRTGLIGTIVTRIGPESLTSVRTTPEASDFQRLLARMRDAGVAKVAVEVSSHALELKRVDGTRFAVAAFTNLSRDHLDFHGSMDRYRAAKQRLFTEFDVGTAVVNIEDPVGSRIAAARLGKLITVGRAGDFYAEDMRPQPGGTRFTLHTPDGSFDVQAPIFGRFNVSNLLVAVAATGAVGVELANLLPRLETLQPVPGRFEIVSRGDEPTVIVDYAHTPEGIEMAVAAGREVAAGRVIVVFGAGGDRDRAKRPLMGAAASAADLAVVTSDNPRSEDPDEIIDEVAAGMGAGHIRRSDRRTAITEAVSAARPGDVVLILGKGHEPGQETVGLITPFDDREVAREILDLLRKSANLDRDSGSIGP